MVDLKFRADLNFEVDFGVNASLGWLWPSGILFYLNSGTFSSIFLKIGTICLWHNPEPCESDHKSGSFKIQSFFVVWTPKDRSTSTQSWKFILEFRGQTNYVSSHIITACSSQHTDCNYTVHVHVHGLPWSTLGWLWAKLEPRVDRCWSRTAVQNSGPEHEDRYNNMLSSKR